jgi:hypothetical protein
VTWGGAFSFVDRVRYRLAVAVGVAGRYVLVVTLGLAVLAGGLEALAWLKTGEPLAVESGSLLLALLPKSVLAWLASESQDWQGFHKLVLAFMELPLALCILILGVPLSLALMGVANVIYPEGEA